MEDWFHSVSEAFDGFVSGLTDPLTLELPRTISILVLGSKGVGKTSLAQRFVTHGFDEGEEIRYIPTGSVKGFWRTEIIEGERAAIHIIDTPGSYDVEDAADIVEDHGLSQFVLSAEEGTVERLPQPAVRSVLDDQSGMHHAGIVVVFDVNRRASFEEARVLLQAAQKQLVSSRCSCSELHTPLLLVANKIDRPKRRRTTPRKEAEGFAKGLGAGYVEASALMTRRTDEVFRTVAKRVCITALCAEYRMERPLKEVFSSLLPDWLSSKDEEEEDEDEEAPPVRSLCMLDQRPAEDEEEDEEEWPPWPPEPMHGNTQGARRMCKKLARMRKNDVDEILSERRSKADAVKMTADRKTYAKKPRFRSDEETFAPHASLHGVPPRSDAGQQHQAQHPQRGHQLQAPEDSVDILEEVKAKLGKALW